MRHSQFFLIFLILFSSCSREIADYDFGEFEYDDPFYGISEEYRPEFLKKTLEYPPFSWFTDDSTYQSAYLFHVEFNEGCVRDKEPVEFCITDPAGNVINYLSIECEGKVTHNGFFYVYPNALQKDIYIHVDAPLEIGDSIITGNIVVNRETIDEVNEAGITNPYQPIGSFYFAHRVSMNWIIILLWLVCLALILFLVFIFFKWLFGIIPLSCSSLISSFKSPMTSNSTKRSAKKTFGKINKQLFHLYASRIQGINALYADLEAKEIKDYVGPLLPYCWEEQYLKSKHQLVIFGQETNGWYCDYMNSKEEIRKNIQMYKDFRLGGGYNSLFWQYAHWFNKELNGFDEQNFVWLNINKFGRDSGVGRPEQAVLDDEVRFYNLLTDELSVLKPDVCLFFTGPNYDQDIVRKLPDVTFHEFGNFGLREVARLSSKHLPRHSYRTYHPGYGNRISETYQRILNTILEECNR